MEPTDIARDYYRHVDAGAYDALAALLGDSFVHVRPDRTIEGADEFVRFMRDDRPLTDTEHEVETVYEADGRVAVEGRLVRATGARMFDFVDTFDVTDGRITRIRTYTD
ncbi:nuclear transport factor 2 family protein [Salinirubellus salinus]|uniref:Nuclear transport factor 2 family protein n=1 Tax=Salinirubellus salinus TaxID=1364945 RepID=A0A9E7UCK6_9EURY|nr:nuclear transport factor 2 family protein [Salinirubellus salinus]UWM55939.1 nuclear transport factor 2 family protein [Salinirubellus salinus]